MNEIITANIQGMTKDQVMRKKYDRIRVRSGGKRAILAIARTLLLRMRRMLLDGQAYDLQRVAKLYKSKKTGLGHGERYL